MEARSKEEIERSYQELAAKLGIAQNKNQTKPNPTMIAGQKTFQELARDIYSELNSSQKFKNWLLIYDDAGTEDEFFYMGSGIGLPELRESNRGHILITSRSPTWVQATSVELSTFTKEEAVSYISNVLPTETEDAKIKLAESLGLHPLGLTQALAYINQTRKSIEIYLKTRQELMDKIVSSSILDGYSTSVKVNVELAINALKTKGDPASLLAVKLIEAMSLVTVEPVWKSTLAAIANNKDNYGAALKLRKIISS
ncbi:MAG: hypothetical protein MRQ09_00665 [Candidatus Midichloria sp.]|nr:hypothetical protein [Candidatus Midichloria sp.]